MNRRDELWKRIWAATLTRRAVRVVFRGPDSEPDPRLEQAREKIEVRPMDAAFFESVKAFLDLAAEKQRQWSEVVKPKADAAMSELWTKLWKTPEGRSYQELKAEVDRRKTQVDAVCRKAEDGIAQKVLAGGRLVQFVKASVLIGREDLLAQARQDVGRLKHELSQAKERLKQLEKGQDDALERVNLLVVEELKTPGKPKPALRERLWTRRAGVEAVQEGLGAVLQIGELIADELVAIDNLADELVVGLEDLAAQAIAEEELQDLAPAGEPELAEVM